MADRVTSAVVEVYLEPEPSVRVTEAVVEVWIDPVNFSGSEVGSGVDDAALTVDLTASESGVGVDAATVEGDGATPQEGSEAGSGTDDAALAAAVAGEDTGSGLDDASLSAALSGVETGSGSDDALLAVELSDSDTGAGVDDATLDDGSGQDGVDTETGSGVDDASLIATLSGSDVGSGVEDASVEASVAAAETGTGSDVASLDKEDFSSDAGAGEELAHVSKWLGELPSPAPAEIPATIRYDGTDITSRVQIGTATFTTGAKGRAGTCSIRVRDDGQEYEFVQGRSLTLDVNDVREWTGFVASVRRGFYFNSTDKPIGQLERYFEVTGVDVNVLLQRRVLHDKIDPANMQLTTYPAGSQDDVILKQYMADHLDLSGDGLTTDLIEHVGTPSIDSDISAPAGWTWDELMQMLTRDTGAVYYIDPERRVVLTDVDTPTSALVLTDNPSAAPIPAFEDSFDRSSLGPDYTVDGGSAAPAVDGTLLVPGGFEWALLSFSPPLGPGTLMFDFYVDPDPGASGAFYEVDLVPFQALDGNWYQAYVYVYGNGDGTWTLEIAEGIGFTSTVTFIPEEGWHSLRYQYDIDDLFVSRARVWRRGEPEPEAWNISVAPTLNLSAAGDPAIYMFSDAEAARLDNLKMWDAVVDRDIEIGCRDFEIDYDGAAMVNDALAWGVGQGSSSPVFSRRSDDTSIAAHRRWQAGRMNQSVWRQATIDRIADSLVFGSPQSKRGGKDDAVSVKATVFRQGLRVGMKARVRSDVFGFDDVLPVRSATVTFPTGRDPKYELVLSHEVDDPWSTFEYWIPDVVVPNFRVPVIEAWVPVIPLPGFDPCAEAVDTCFYDLFDRANSGSWGTADSGETWQQLGSDPGGVSSEAGVVHDSPAHVGTTGSSGETASDAEARVEGLSCVLPVDLFFDFHYVGEWNSSSPWNNVPDNAADNENTFWAPGFEDPGIKTQSHPATYGPDFVVAEYCRQFLDVRLQINTIDQRLRIYNSGGSLYVASFAGPNFVSAVQRFPVEVGGALAAGEICHVRLHADSDRVYMRVWKEGAAEPNYWQVQTDAHPGATYNYLISLLSMSESRHITSTPYQLIVDNIELGEMTTVGAGMGLFGDSVLAEDTFDDRAVAAGQFASWGAFSDGSVYFWDSFASETGDLVEVISGEAKLHTQGSSPEHLLEQRVLADNNEGVPQWSSPYDIRLRARFIGVQASTAQFLRIVAVSKAPHFIYVSFSPGGNQTQIVGADSGTVSYGGPVDEDVEIRVRVLSNEILVRWWATGDSEPGVWQVSDTITTSIVDSDVVRIGAQTPSSTELDVYLDFFRVEAVGIAGPCGSATPGEYQDGSPGARGEETLSEVTTPSGGDPTSTWFQTDHQYVPGSERVFLNGLLLRPGVDYARHAVDRLVEVFSSVTIDPGDVVYASYEVFLSTPAPEFL